MRTPSASDTAPLILAVGGGQGGIGKSLIVANVAVAMSKLGARVTVVEAEVGSTRLAHLLGIEEDGQSLQALFEGRVSTLQELVVRSSHPRLSLIAASDAPEPAANLQHGRKLKLLAQLGKLDAEVVIVDCGSGAHKAVAEYFTIADAGLVVTSPHLGALQNAYGVLKAVVQRQLDTCARALKRTAMLAPTATSATNENVQQLLARLATEDVELVRELRQSLLGLQISLLGNQLTDVRELGAVHALSRLIGDFLCLRVRVRGGLRRLDRINQSVMRRKPFVSGAMLDPESMLLLKIAESLLSIDVQASRRDRGEAKPEPVSPPGKASVDPLRATVEDPVEEVRLPATLDQYSRADERYAVRWPVVLETPGGVRPALVSDISHGGARLELPNPPVVGTRIALIFDANPKPIRLRARIVRAPMGSAGIKFDPAPPETKIAVLVARAAAEQVASPPRPSVPPIGAP